MTERGWRRRLAWQLNSWLAVDPFGDPARASVILGSARSGTTWLEEVVNRNQDHRLLFEPFRPGVTATKDFWTGPYLEAAHSGDDRLVPAMAAVLSGHIRDPWVDHLNRKRFARRRLIKEIRGNMLVGWMNHHFPATRTILVLRHPGAVAASRNELGWHDQLTPLLTDRVIDAQLGDAGAWARRQSDPWVRTLAAWAAENLVALRTLDPRTTLVTTYEQLTSDGKSEAPRILRHLGQPTDKALWSQLEQPSHLSRADSSIRIGADRLGRWRQRRSQSELRAIDEVLNRFELLDVYRSSRDLPDINALAKRISG